MDTTIIDKIIPKIKGKLSESIGVRLFANHGSSFEQWLQIEICGALKELGMVTIPEKPDCLKSHDIYFRDMHSKEYLIELKVVCLQSKYDVDGVKRNKGTTLSGVSQDIEKLSNKSNVCRIILFASFPGSVNEDKDYYDGIKKSVAELKSAVFEFCKQGDNEMGGCLYWGLLK
jgi:hypothetical protein